MGRVWHRKGPALYGWKSNVCLRLLFTRDLWCRLDTVTYSLNGENTTALWMLGLIIIMS
jgi:hypothetical protein